MGAQKWHTIRDERLDKKTVHRIKAEALTTLLQMDKNELRRHTSKTQSELTCLLDAHQSDGSKTN